MRNILHSVIAFSLAGAGSLTASAPSDVGSHLSHVRAELRALSEGYSGKGTWKTEIHALANQAGGIKQLDPPDGAHGVFQIRVHAGEFRVDVAAIDATPRYVKAYGDRRVGGSLFGGPEQQIWSGPGGLGATARRDRTFTTLPEAFPDRCTLVHLELAQELEFPWPQHLRALNSTVAEPRVIRDPSGLVRIEVEQRTPSAAGKPDSVELRTIVLDPSTGYRPARIDLDLNGAPRFRRTISWQEIDGRWLPATMELRSYATAELLNQVHRIEFDPSTLRLGRDAAPLAEVRASPETIANVQYVAPMSGGPTEDRGRLEQIKEQPWHLLFVLSVLALAGVIFWKYRRAQTTGA